jgi:hypothetical protein
MKGVLTMKHMHQSCPSCKSGILEPCIVLNMENGRVQVELYDPEKKQVGIIFSVCSRECGEVKMEAVPDVGRLWAKWARDQYLSGHRKTATY